MAMVHGLNYGYRESDIERIYTGSRDAENLLDRYNVDYAVVGPAERTRFKVNETFFARCSKLSRLGGCDLYQIRRQAAP